MPILILIDVQIYKTLFLALKKVLMVKITPLQIPPTQYKNSSQENSPTP